MSPCLPIRVYHLPFFTNVQALTFKIPRLKYFAVLLLLCVLRLHIQETPEAVIRRCSLKKLLLKMSSISHENTCVGVSF